MLTKAAKEELALALLLWKDFKSEGRFDPDIIQSCLKLAQTLGVQKELDQLMAQLPPMKIEPRFKGD